MGTLRPFPANAGVAMVKAGTPPPRARLRDSDPFPKIPRGRASRAQPIPNPDEPRSLLWGGETGRDPVGQPPTSSRRARWRSDLCRACWTVKVNRAGHSEQAGDMTLSYLRRLICAGADRFLWSSGTTNSLSGASAHAERGGIRDRRVRSVVVGVDEARITVGDAIPRGARSDRTGAVGVGRRSKCRQHPDLQR